MAARAPSSKAASAASTRRSWAVVQAASFSRPPSVRVTRRLAAVGGVDITRDEAGADHLPDQSADGARGQAAEGGNVTDLCGRVLTEHLQQLDLRHGKGHREGGGFRRRRR